MFFSRGKVGHKTTFEKKINLGGLHLISQNRAIDSIKSILYALPQFPDISLKLQRNQLSNVQDMKFLKVAPLPKFYIRNIFMAMYSARP